MDYKYYIPKIEEFYVGFEFEHKDDNYDGREEFQKTIIESDNLLKYPNEVGEYNYCEYEHLLSSIKYDIEHGDVRVKYLDKEDINELNFILFNWNDKYCRHRLGGYTSGVFDELLQYPSIFEIIVDKNNPTHIKIEKAIFNKKQMYYDWGTFLFDGVIKNKSELKKLLIQLEIINE